MNGRQVTAVDGSFAVTEFEVPENGSTDVLVVVEATSVGLTVQNQVRSYLGNDEELLPRVPGHEIIGWAFMSLASNPDAAVSFFYSCAVRSVVPIEAFDWFPHPLRSCRSFDASSRFIHSRHSPSVSNDIGILRSETYHYRYL